MTRSNIIAAYLCNDYCLNSLNAITTVFAMVSDHHNVNVMLSINQQVLTVLLCSYNIAYLVKIIVITIYFNSHYYETMYFENVSLPNNILMESLNLMYLH